MDLPIEIRLMIAIHALRSDNPLWFQVDSTSSVRKGTFQGLEECTGLVRTCKQFHAELSSLVWFVPTFGFIGPRLYTFLDYTDDPTRVFFKTFDVFVRQSTIPKLGNVRIYADVIKHKSRPWGLEGFAKAVAQLPKVVLDANREFEDPSGSVTKSETRPKSTTLFR